MPTCGVLFYLVIQNRVEYTNQVKQRPDAAEALNYAEHNQTTRPQLVPDAGDHDIERLMHISSARPHTSTVTSFHFQVALQ